MGKKRRPRDQPRAPRPVEGPARPPGRWDCSGADADDFQSKGLERQLAISTIGRLRKLKGCPTRANLKSASWPEGYLRGSKGTPNHRIGTRVDTYIWALMEGSQADIDDARALVLDAFAEQRRTGHMLGEQTTTSHPQIHYYEVLACCAVALHFKDEEVIEATGQWLRVDYDICDATAFDGVPVTPGARPGGVGDPLRRANPVRTVMYWLYDGNGLRSDGAIVNPCPALPKGWGNPNDPRSGFWRNAYAVACWIARELVLVEGDDLGGTRRGLKERAVLRGAMEIQRRGADYVMVVRDWPKSGPIVLPAIWRVDGVEGESEEKRGRLRDWRFEGEVPRLDDAEVRVIAGSGLRAAQIVEEDDAE